MHINMLNAGILILRINFFAPKLSIKNFQIAIPGTSKILFNMADNHVICKKPRTSGVLLCVRDVFSV